MTTTNKVFLTLYDRIPGFPLFNYMREGIVRCRACGCIWGFNPIGKPHPTMETYQMLSERSCDKCEPAPMPPGSLIVSASTSPPPLPQPAPEPKGVTAALNRAIGKPAAQPQREVGEDWLPGIMLSPSQFVIAHEHNGAIKYLRRSIVARDALWRAEVRRLNTERLDMRQHAQEWEEEATRLRTQLAEMTRRADGLKQTATDLEKACIDLRSGPQF